MHTLHHDDVIVAALASGSRGNCTYIGTDEEGVLVDCGLSTRQIFRRLDELGLADVAIRGVLLTHEHSDHVGAARVLDRAFQKTLGRPVPFYMTRGTRRGLPRQCVPSTILPITSGRTFQVGDFLVEAWTIPHDTVDPVAYAVNVGSLRAGIITDLGRSTRLVERQLASLDIAVLEFNHDLDMLMQGAYPWRLKQRVRGAHGHLSNAQAAQIVARGASDRLKHLVLAHLSDDNNTPERALQAANEALHASDAAKTTVHVARQVEPLGPLRLQAPAAPRPSVRPRTTSTAPAPVCASQLSLFG
jgi:phosphoribosyl 1,2-cyclic phosphodiesterase